MVDSTTQSIGHTVLTSFFYSCPRCSRHPQYFRIPDVSTRLWDLCHRQQRPRSKSGWPSVTWLESQAAKHFWPADDMYNLPGIIGFSQMCSAYPQSCIPNLRSITYLCANALSYVFHSFLPATFSCFFLFSFHSSRIQTQEESSWWDQSKRLFTWFMQQARFEGQNVMMCRRMWECSASWKHLETKGVSPACTGKRHTWFKVFLTGAIFTLTCAQHHILSLKPDLLPKRRIWGTQACFLLFSNISQLFVSACFRCLPSLSASWVTFTNSLAQKTL